ncbi:restriction endonuclease [Paeniglutamicibacter antarcticus]|uniref:Restriction endonuclease n=1 Tax=Arthrobacter terrae TaxID=2935737 RepID=A0A931G9A5_9MICC|nr:restriction endonuclease [Arthrobacter terrae]MBG0740984.1 restriction endonuclease [Arthrobacter terrae]
MIMLSTRAPAAMPPPPAASVPPKGILLTTSEFTDGAKTEAPKARHKHIILIDGRQLASLMVQHNIGVEVDQLVEIKRIDGAFFTFDEE